MAVPAGIVMSFAGSDAPEGWLLCDGSAVSRTDYADLFTVIGTTYGSGDGETTFNLPNLSGRVAIGVSNSHALGTTGGEETVTLSETELPEHSHVVPTHGHGNNISAKTPSLAHTITQPVFKYNSPNNSGAGGYYGTNRFTGTTTATATRSANLAISNHAAANCTMSGSVTDCDAFDTQSVGGGDPHNNLQPYLAIKYIICAGA